MVVSTIALYASPPHPCQINTHSNFDFELNPRCSSATSSSAAGGLSSLFSSPATKFAGDREELGSLWHDRGEDLKELSSSLRYSQSKCITGSSMKRDPSPISVLQGPISCSSSPPMRRGVDLGFQSSIRNGASGLFNGFVRNAIGSYVDYDSPTFEINRGESDLDYELTFNMEGNFVEAAIDEPYAKELLLKAQLRHKIFTEDFVIKAFYEAERAHRGQMRASGDPYLQHCVETAVLLAQIGANSTVVAAGLLHDTLDDAFICYDYIFKTFGDGVANLVEGVSKLSHLSKLARDSNTADKTTEADRLHTMFLAMADARAVLIKLADRLHNMMTLDALPPIKKQRFAKETLEIFVPLANRLGISSWKEQLENLCFKHLNPEQHRDLSSKLVESFDEAMISSATEKLEKALEEDGMSYHDLYGRHKSLYSIHCKMLKKKLKMDEIHDIHGLRLIVDNKEDCYRALKVVHRLWSEVPGKFKDYIIHPKFNGYQSLHTVVRAEGTMPLEVQIRTKDMHLQAEYGFAAHWRYKEYDSKHSSFVLQMVEYARWILSWQCEAISKDKPPCAFPTHADGCPNSYKPECDNDGPVFIIMIENDKMLVQEFPVKSTVMDLLERRGWGRSTWSFYGFQVKEELRPRLNHKALSDPSCKLKMGDVVELTPPISDKSLVECREEIRRMYGRIYGQHVLTTATSTTGPAVGWRN